MRAKTLGMGPFERLGVWLRRHVTRRGLAKRLDREGHWTTEELQRRCGTGEAWYWVTDRIGLAVTHRIGRDWGDPSLTEDFRYLVIEGDYRTIFYD